MDEDAILNALLNGTSLPPSASGKIEGKPQTTQTIMQNNNLQRPMNFHSPHALLQETINQTLKIKLKRSWMELKSRQINMQDFFNMIFDTLPADMALPFHQIKSSFSNAQIPTSSSTVKEQTIETASEIALAMPNSPMKRKREMADADDVPRMTLRSSLSSSVPQKIIEDEDVELEEPPVAKDVDVTRMKSEDLQDVLKYSGVNEEEEANEMLENIEEYSVDEDDAKDLMSSYVNLVHVEGFKAAITRAMRKNGLGNIKEVCLDYLAIAVHERIKHMLEELIAISRHRLDTQREQYSWKLLNDPKKQVWLLDKYDSDVNNLFMEGKEISGIQGDDGKMKKNKKVPTKKNEKEETAIKAKLANTTAFAALGGTKKSWMSGGGSSVNNSSNLKSKGLKAEKNQLETAQKHHKTQLQRRSIALKDLLFLIETEPHYRKSTLLFNLLTDLK
ncbi:Transcription initiation factor TFIID component TAF4 domain-containing protein [Rozella allomycis CSF55]|uniref:Transcription initiation factor TFIID subunit 4 n=1 Tax=Rozella allomycis (strain CSF55) TaxID=988480 RepID=A0A075AW94_ROZAC|nr:Transcription initiation factor TFIID component TAF4 domain-containing protein [Rozella allomycis CSF55]|eukprot:EPZ34427.1 Transcription initiation factor TFIID component TAF4 domain-containing protein [Rozella allomycis CSF55]